MQSALYQTRWAIDSLVVGEGSLFSHGWVAAASQDVLQLSMLVRYADGLLETVSTEYGLNRPDVLNSFPELRTACGFMVHASLKHQGEIAAVSLQAMLADGTTRLWACPIPGDLAAAPKARPSSANLTWQRLLRDGLRVPGMLLSGRWRAVLSGARSRWTWLKPKSADELELKKLLERFGANAVLIVDHSLGGGANLFRERLVQKHLDAGRSVALWTFVPYLLKHELQLYFSAGQAELRRYVEWSAWDVLALSGKFTDIEFNNCVGFPRQEDMGAALTMFKNTSGAKLCFYLHDYHMVCPSHFLLNDSGRFCGVPDLEQCRRCLPRIQDNLANLFVARDIDLWRGRWATALESADEIVHFSASTRQLFSRAYPGIRETQWQLCPHHVPQWGGRFVYPRDRSNVRVGVVGHIGRAKGSEVVLELARYVKHQGVKLEIVVIGTLEGAFDDLAVTATGHYKHADLIQLINSNQLHMALMPSVVPETFSYVTHELIQQEVPIMCFDLGAQAEAVGRYARGCVVPLGSSALLLQSILHFKLALEIQTLS